MDQNNPVVKLCTAGMQAEAERRPEEAARLFEQAWALRADDLDGCIAAHYLARHRPVPAENLHWNQTALELADRVGDDRVRGFYSSLHLNVGLSHEKLGDLRAARRHYRIAAERLADVPAGPYGELVRGGVASALDRTRAVELEPGTG
jgi:hypothetical protein